MRSESIEALEDAGHDVRLDDIPIAACMFDTTALEVLNKNAEFRYMFGLRVTHLMAVVKDAHHTDVIKSRLCDGEHEFALEAVSMVTVDGSHHRRSMENINRSVVRSPSMDFTLDLPKLAVRASTTNFKGCLLFDINIKVCRDQPSRAIATFSMVDRYRVAQLALYKMLYFHHNVIKCMYPKHVTDVITHHDYKMHDVHQMMSRFHKNVTVCFSDIVGFTNMCGSVEPHEVMRFLNDYFSELDSELNTYNIFRYETIGDCYVCVAGLGMYNDHDQFVVEEGEERGGCDAAKAVQQMLGFARHILHVAATKRLGPHKIAVRVGIHTGNVTSGIIDNTMPKYSLFGDTMNVASRMETNSAPGCINVSPSTWALMTPSQRDGFEPQVVDVKGKGEMTTYIRRLPHISSCGTSPEFPRSTRSQKAARFMEYMAFANHTAMTSSYNDPPHGVHTPRYGLNAKSFIDLVNADSNMPEQAVSDGLIKIGACTPADLDRNSAGMTL